MSLSEREAAEAPAGPAALLHLRRFSAMTPKVLLIGASTGGPQALRHVLADAPEWLRQIPIVVVLHLPPDFTEVVASDIARAARMPARVAQNGERLAPGTIYFAPGDKHLRVMRTAHDLVLVHADTEPQNFCKPSVDVLFRSAAKALGAQALGLVLTGMGRDGLAGACAMAAAGGTILVQDETTSVVWGMPGAIARAGVASAILPLETIASAISGLVASSRRGARA